MRRSTKPDPTMEEVNELEPGTYYYRDGLVLKVVPRTPGGGSIKATWYYRYRSRRTGNPTETSLECSALAFEAYEARRRILAIQVNFLDHNRDPTSKREARKPPATFRSDAEQWIALTR